MALSAVSLVGGVGMLLVAIGFVAYALMRRLGWRFLALGMLGWVVTVAIKVMIALPLNAPVIEATKSLTQPWATLALFLYGGLMTGVTEVGIVWLVLRYSRLGRAPWNNVLAFGIGFGAIEAFLLGLGSFTAALVGIFAADQLPAEIFKSLAEADNIGTQLAPIWERFFTCLGHVGTSVMIFHAASRHQVRWFWSALIYKSAIDGIAALAIVEQYLKSATHLWTLEAIVAVWGLVGLAITIWIGKRYLKPEPPSESVLAGAAVV